MVERDKEAPACCIYTLRIPISMSRVVAHSLLLGSNGKGLSSARSSLHQAKSEKKNRRVSPSSLVLNRPRNSSMRELFPSPRKQTDAEHTFRHRQARKRPHVPAAGVFSSTRPSLCVYLPASVYLAGYAYLPVHFLSLSRLMSAVTEYHISSSLSFSWSSSSSFFKDQVRFACRTQRQHRAREQTQVLWIRKKHRGRFEGEREKKVSCL